MIQTLLVANRGEIALRIMRACRELGVETIAVYSDADRLAPHVFAADRAVHIGASPAVESYLDIAKLMDAARGSGADAIHPGYGFLSENPAFAAACEDARIVFVGPPSDVIARMGSKVGARQLMERAGVPVVPGETPEDQSDAGVRRAIDRVGLPALVKASAGGGGKGMRAIRDPTEIDDGIQAARREAIAAFGDGMLYVERLLEHPRHVEVQIFGDDRGEVVHLFERECSVQRRHQKVIEESPSPAISPSLRTRLTGAAIAAATAVSYRGAGTVEFLVDLAAGSPDAAAFYFLEMNTRLQVEHAVTEQVVGVDLVRAQLLVASGEGLPWRQDSLSQRGHAIEARVYAEDSSHNFLPQAGSLLLYREPRLPGIRIDAGVVEGGTVPIHYDPLLSKVIATAETRDAASARLAAALRAYPVLGIRTNIPFLLRVIEHPAFRAGAVDTGFLDAEGAALAVDPEGDGEGAPATIRRAAAAHAAVGVREARGVDATDWDPWSRLQGWRG